MTFVDLVFPAFLFIVGMSVPFAFNARLLKGDSTKTIWKHTFKRALALIIIGVFMVNAEYGYDASKMIITPAFWGLLAYLMPIPIWNKYPYSGYR
jgi:predicted acyltransferase